MQRNGSDGATGVPLNPAEFAGFDRGCAEFLRVIGQLIALAGEIGARTRWGLGEDDARLISAATVVARLRAKADGDANSIAAVLAAHADIVAELRSACRSARDELIRTDDDWAGQVGAAETDAGQPTFRQRLP
ncbi:hypothetical protein ATM97_09420 [Nocardia sp. MH4]|nr:hypothetical protein [Nocardia sp. MH4]